MPTLQSGKGFTLIEVMIAIVVLAVGVMSLYTMQISSMRGNTHASRITEASNWGADQIEHLLQMEYADLAAMDVDGDGTGQDGDGDGIDDDGGNYGLDDIQVATADGSAQSPDGNYTLFWNIALDYPVANTLTVRIHTQDNRQILGNTIVYNYIKNGNI